MPAHALLNGENRERERVRERVRGEKIKVCIETRFGLAARLRVAHGIQTREAFFMALPVRSFGSKTTRLPAGARQAICLSSRIRPAPRERRGWRGAAEEQESEEVDGVGDIERAVVVRVGRVEA